MLIKLIFEPDPPADRMCASLRLAGGQPSQQTKSTTIARFYIEIWYDSARKDTGGTSYVLGAVGTVAGFCNTQEDIRKTVPISRQILEHLFTSLVRR